MGPERKADLYARHFDEAPKWYVFKVTRGRSARTKGAIPVRRQSTRRGNQWRPAGNTGLRNREIIPRLVSRETI